MPTPKRSRMEPVGVRFAAGDGDRSWRGELRALSKAPCAASGMTAGQGASRHARTLRRVSYPVSDSLSCRRQALVPGTAAGAVLQIPHVGGVPLLICFRGPHGEKHAVAGAGVRHVGPAHGGDFRPPQPAHEQQAGDHGVESAPAPVGGRAARLEDRAEVGPSGRHLSPHAPRENFLKARFVPRKFHQVRAARFLGDVRLGRVGISRPSPVLQRV